MENNNEQYEHPEELRRLKAAYSDVVLPASLEGKTIKRLKNEQLIYKWYTRRSLKIAAGLLIIIAAFGGGWLYGKTDVNRAAGTTGKHQAYLALLYDTKDFIKNEQQVKEYGAWMNDIYSKGITISGSELKEDGWVLRGDTIASSNATPNPYNDGKASGYFIIEALSEKTALQCIASCPHLKYNGLIELRPLDTQ